MRFRLIPRCLIALCLILLAGSLARADFVNWSYNWTHSPVVVAADVYAVAPHIGRGGWRVSSQIQ